MSTQIETRSYMHATERVLKRRKNVFEPQVLSVTLTVGLCNHSLSKQTTILDKSISLCNSSTSVIEFLNKRTYQSMCAHITLSLQIVIVDLLSVSPIRYP